MELTAVDSSLISHRGYDPSTRIMQIRFCAPKGFALGGLYEYGNVSPELYDSGLKHRNASKELSFGQFFQMTIKNNPKQFPFRKLEDPSNPPTEERDTFMDSTVSDRFKASIEYEATIDFTATGQTVPVAITEDIAIPSDPEALKAAALELSQKAQAIQINSTEAYKLAGVVGVAIARMRDALEKTMRPEIERLRAPYKAALDILTRYDKPLESDQNRLRAGMVAFKREQDAIALRKANEERQERQRIADAEAAQKAEELKLADAIEAEQRGEIELAKTIIEAPALPLTSAYVPPVMVQSEAPKIKGSVHREKWCFEYIDEIGNPVAQPRMDLIPLAYHLPNEAAFTAAAKTTKGHTNIPGIRVYDAGNIAFSKKG